jgi:hypothetical protein
MTVAAWWSACWWIGADELAARRDADGDGFDAAQFGGDDCDDTRADVHPGAPDEPGDDVDADCAPGAHTGDPPPHSAPAHSAPDPVHSAADHSACADCEPALLLNEVLARPPDPLLLDAGDANCDGVSDPAEDEFVELVNVGPVPIELAGGTVSDDDATRFTFPPTARPLAPGDVVVVFGGGSWGLPGGGLASSGPWCRSRPSNAVVFVAGGLSLDHAGDRLTVDLPGLRYTADWSNAPDGVSLNRDPDLDDGPLVRHTLVPGERADFSPMRGVDLEPLPSP